MNPRFSASRLAADCVVGGKWPLTTIVQSDAELQTATAAPISSHLEVSVIIPCLNEANSVAICIDKALAAIAKLGVSGEVVVADNGSTDASVEIAKLHGARVVHVAAKGYGNALRAGIAAARGEFIVMGDADDSYDFSELPKFVEKRREGYEFVMGNRLRGEIKPAAMPWHHRYVGTPVMSFIINVFFRAGIGDVNCGMRGFTRTFYDRLDIRTTGMEFASELVVKAARHRAQIAEIPITLWPDKRGRPPHLRSFRDGWRHLRFMLLYAPNWLFLLPGAFLAGLGLGIVVWLLPGPRTVGRTVIDVHTMLFGMVFALIGVNIATIGMFAKVFSYTERFARRQYSLERWFKRIKLETGLAAGTALAAIGTSGLFVVTWRWIKSGFGPFHEMRAVIFFSLFFLLGMHTIFASFFFSMLGISRSTYIGDYEASE